MKTKYSSCWIEKKKTKSKTYLKPPFVYPDVPNVNKASGDSCPLLCYQRSSETDNLYKSGVD